MSITAVDGPLVTYGTSASASGSAGYNPHAGPSLSYQGVSVLDPQTPYYNGGGGRLRGFLQPVLCSVDAVPAALSATRLAAAQSVTTVGTVGANMTLVSATGIGVIYNPVTISLPNATRTNPTTKTWTYADGTIIVAPSVLALDSYYVDLQSTGGEVSSDGSTRTNFFDPSAAIARALIVTWAGVETVITGVTIYGADVYGAPMSETLAYATTSTTGKKAFKYIFRAKVNAPSATTSVGNISLGTTDIFGIHTRAMAWGNIEVFMNAATVTASTGFVAAVTTTASATTGDVRGTYAVQSASDGSKRLQIFVKPRPADVVAATYAAPATLLGVTQF